MQHKEQRASVSALHKAIELPATQDTLSPAYQYHQSPQNIPSVPHSQVSCVRSKQLWAKLRSRVIRGADFSKILRTIRALHSAGLIHSDFFDGFPSSSKAVDAAIQHSLRPHAPAIWLDAHCLSEDDARKLQRSFGFHSKTFFLLYSQFLVQDIVKSEREVLPLRIFRSLVLSATNLGCSDVFLVHSTTKQPIRH
jgi:hypothetical protein